MTDKSPTPFSFNLETDYGTLQGRPSAGLNRGWPGFSLTVMARDAGVIADIFADWPASVQLTVGKIGVLVLDDDTGIKFGVGYTKSVVDDDKFGTFFGGLLIGSEGISLTTRATAGLQTPIYGRNTRFPAYSIAFETPSYYNNANNYPDFFIDSGLPSTRAYPGLTYPNPNYVPKAPISGLNATPPAAPPSSSPVTAPLAPVSPSVTPIMPTLPTMPATPMVPAPITPPSVAPPVVQYPVAPPTVQNPTRPQVFGQVSRTRDVNRGGNDHDRTGSGNNRGSTKSSGSGSSSGSTSSGAGAGGGASQGSSSGGAKSGAEGSSKGSGYASTPDRGPSPSSRPSGGSYDGWNGPDEADRGWGAKGVGGFGDLGGAPLGGTGPDNTSGPLEITVTEPNGIDYSNSGYASDSKPVLLDLSGNGLSVDGLDTSSRFVDFDGDGYEQRTAWAGKGNGVLVLDADGDGKISRSSEFAFTEWDPAADGDLQALKSAFDTNGNGKLDAGDARWAEFKVMVGDELVSLASLGIESIDLTPSGSGQVFADGSAITGTTIFTRTDGSTGQIGNAVLAGDSESYIVERTSAANPDGSKTEELSAYNKDGSLAFRNLITVSADGLHKATQFDDDGNGTYDRSQTETLRLAGPLQADTPPPTPDTPEVTPEDIIGTSDGDNLVGTAGDDVIRGGEGNDTLYGLAGNDFLIGDGGSYNQADYDGYAADYTFTRNPDGSVTVSHPTDGVDTLVGIDGLWFHGEEQWYSITDLAPSATGETTSVGTGYGNYFGGTENDDTVNFTGGIGNYVDADAGNDTIVFSGDVTEYRIQGQGAHFVVSHVVTGEEIQFTNVEFIKFSGGPALSIADIVVASGHQPGEHWPQFEIIDRARTRTISNFAADGSLLNQTVIVTSADLKTVTTTLDQDGDGQFDQSQVFVTNPDGSTSTVVKEFAVDGTLLEQIATTSSADGLTKITQYDETGSGAFNLEVTESTVVNGDGSRTKTATQRSLDGTIIGRTIEQISADGRAQTVEYDHVGSGVIDEREVSVTTVGSDGSVASSVSVYNGDGSLRGKANTATSADGLSKTLASDLDGDAVADSVASDITSVAGDGARLQTVEERSANGTLLARKVTSTSGDRKTISIVEDVNGDGFSDATTTILVNVDGSTSVTSELLNPDGSLNGRMVADTSADGFAQTTSVDMDGNGTFDETTTDVTVLNVDGSRTQTVTNTIGSTVAGSSVSTTSQDSLVKTVQIDLDGDGTFDRAVSDVTALDVDGSRTQTVITTSADSTQLAKSVATLSADRKTVTASIDENGDGAVDRLEVAATADNGNVAETIALHNADGSLRSKLVTATSADGLTETVQYDINGDNIFDGTTTSAIVINSDGSRTATISGRAGNDTLISQAVATVSANGLTSTVSEDIDGNGSVDRKVNDVTVINADGSRTNTVTTIAGTNTIAGRVVTTVSDNGLETTVGTDADGDGTVDRVVSATKTLNADGSVNEIIDERSSNGELLSTSSESTSADGKSVSLVVDANGDGATDLTKTAVVNADGSTTATERWLNQDGSTDAIVEVVTTADGLSGTIKTDATGDSVYDLVETDDTVLNTDGSRTRTVAAKSTDGSLIEKVVATISANGLTQVEQQDVTGDGIFDRIITETIVFNADGSETRTVSTTSTTGTLLEKWVTMVSADRETATTTFDDNGDGAVDRTAVSILNANGSQIETVTETAANGTVISRSLTETAADGLTEILKADVNGDGVYDAAIVDETVINADGSQTRTVTETAGSTLISESVTITSANGLAITSEADVNGDGTTDARRTDTTVLNTDGSTMQTVSDLTGVNGLKSQTITTVSADGLNTKVEADVDGNGVVDRTTSTQRELGADGSIVDTISIKNGNEQLIGHTTASVSADKLTTETRTDLDGDALDDVTSVETINADGSTTTTVSTYTKDGTQSHLASRSVKTVSADGLTITTAIDANGDGSVDKTTESVTVLNVNGSETMTFSERGADGVLKSRTVVDSAANGLSESVQWLADGSAVTRSMSDATVLNTDGSSVRTVAYHKAGGGLESRIVTTMSADGLTTTITKDIDGDGVIDQKAVTTVNADGSNTTSLSDLGTDSVQVIGKKVVTLSANELGATTDYDTNGDGTPDARTVETTVFNADGSKTSTVTHYDDNLQMLDQTVVESSAKERLLTEKWDLDSDGVFENSRSDETVLNADGSTTQTISNRSGAALTSHYQTTTSANGLSTTESWDIDGNAVSDQIATDVSVLNGDGSTTRTVTNSRSDGSLISRSVTTTSADGRTVATAEDRSGSGFDDRTITASTAILADGALVTVRSTSDGSGNLTNEETRTTSGDKREVTIERDVDGDGDIDQIEHSAKLVDGSRKTVITGYDDDSAKANQTIVTNSADGLVSTYEWDLDGDGTIDRRRTVTDAFNIDGSMTNVAVDRDGAGVLLSDTTVNVSADGTTQTTSRDVNGDAVVDQTGTEIIDASGTSVLTVTNNAEARAVSNLVAGTVYWSQAIADTVETTTASDSLAATTRSDYDGDGVFEHIAVTRTQIDGSTVSIITETASGGAITAKGTITTSADGLTTILTKDTDNNGTYDYGETSAIRSDGSILHTAVERNEDGTIKQTTSQSISATGLFVSSSTTDSARRKIGEAVRNADDTTTITAFVAATGQPLSVSQLSKNGILTSAVLYDPLGENPWSRVEQAFDATGKKMIEKQFNDDGTRTDVTFDGASGNPTLVSFYDASGRLTGTTTYDLANSNPWIRMERIFNAAGQITYQNEFNDTGTRTAHTYDPGNAQSWNNIDEYFDTAGRLTSQYEYYDDGRRAVATFDAENSQSWSKIIQSFNTANQLTYDAYYYDDGTRTEKNYDPDNASSWSIIQYSYNDLNKITLEGVSYDDGTRVVKYYDQDHSWLWSNYRLYYNASEQITLDITSFDDGTYVQIYYDPTNNSSWSRIFYSYDASNQLIRDTTTFDDGSSSDTSFDPGNSQPWTRYTNSYDTSGRLAVQTAFNDDGSQNVSSYDAANTQTWYRIDGTYVPHSSGMRLQYQNIHADDGSWVQEEYHLSTGYIAKRQWFSANGIRISMQEYSVFGEPIPPGAPGGSDPVLLDLNGDNHIDLRPFDPGEFAGGSGPRFDWDEDGTGDGTAWVGPDDGFLAIDLGADGLEGADGVIDQAKELAFTLWAREPGAVENETMTDLEALSLVFDTNQDGVLDSIDARWDEFRVWQDVNQNGVTDSGELKTMSEAGIKLINLLPSSSGAVQFSDGSAITGTSSYETADGAARLVGDAALSFRSSMAANLA